MLNLRLLALAALVALPILASPRASHAVPITYNFSSGRVTLFGTANSNVVIDPVNLDLAGVQVTIDTATSSLMSMDLLAPGPLNITLNQNYGGYDSLVIESLQLTGSNGQLILLNPGPPEENFFIVNPLDLDLVFSATGPAPTTPLVSQAITTSTVGTGTLFLDPALNQLSLSGVEIGAIGPLGTESAPILLKGDFIFTGTSATPIPEPAAALAFSVGFATVAGATRRRIANRRN